MVVVDIPWAYLSADMDNNVFMTFRDTISKLMVAADTTLYRKYISYGNKGEELSYVHVQKALYGCLKSTLLFNEKLVGDLVSYVFKINV